MPVELTRRDEFAVVTLNRPQALNALSNEVIRELARCFDEAEAGDARALIITGAGERAFCAGADIGEFLGRSIAEAKAAAERGQRTFARLDRLRLPSVAAINGFALGGGLELAMACTLRVATPNARLGLPEIKLGLIPGYGGTQRLPRLIGQGRALELIMTGRMLTAAEAAEMGLVNRVVEGGAVEGAIAFAREFSGHGLLALKLAREAVQRAGDAGLSEGLDIEADLNTLAFETEDAAEGTKAFLEKRKPQFRDR
jgi:enoyl-CoA hydratase